MNSLKLNLSSAIAAQCVSMTMSIMVSLILPRIFGVEDYAYWQMFILYSGYVGLLHFGLCDGIYLRYGGVNIHDMDKSLIGSQFRLMLTWQMIICLTLFLAASFLVKDASRVFVLRMISVYLVLGNASWFMGFVFQAANETRIYSRSIILSKALFILFFVCALFTDVIQIKTYILAYVIAQGIATIYIGNKGRSFLFAKQIPWYLLVQETKTNVSIGIKLTVANIASSLCMGIGKIFSDVRWSINSFGILAFSISLVNFVLQFIAQISMVMFPALRQTNKDRLDLVYDALNQIIGIILCGLLIFYAPCHSLLAAWLPAYTESFSYLAVLLPVCVLDGKMQLLYNTYLKVLRLEKELLLINLSACALSLIFCILFVHFYNGIIAVAYALLLAVAARNIMGSIYFKVALNWKLHKTTILEFLSCAFFVFLNQTVSIWMAFVIYLLYYCFIVTRLMSTIRCAKSVLLRLS